MEPPAARCIAKTAYFTERNTPSGFTAVCRRQSTSDISTALHKMPIPALATITSRRPKRGSVASDYRGPGLLKSYILMKVDRLAADGPNLFHHRLAAGIVDVGHHRLGAFSRQCRRTRCTNSRCAACDDRYLALCLAHPVLLRLPQIGTSYYRRDSFMPEISEGPLLHR